MILVWLTIFFGTTSVNLTETEQLIASIVPTGLLKILMRKFIVPNTEKETMVWCGLSLNGLLDPYFFDETVTGLTCRRMLVDYGWPQLQCNRLYFQPDGAAPHYAVTVRAWLDEKSVQV